MEYERLLLQEIKIILCNEDQNILANSYKQDEIQQYIKYLNSIHIECDSMFFLEEFFETLIELSALVITLLSTTQQKQLFKPHFLFLNFEGIDVNYGNHKLKNLMVNHGASVKNSIELWIKRVLLSEEWDINQVSYLSLLIDNVAQVHSVLQTHLLAVSSLLAATLSKQIEANAKSPDLLIKSSKLLLQVFRTFKRSIIETLSTCEDKQCFVSVADSCFRLIAQSDCLSASKFCSNVIAHMLSYHGNPNESHLAFKSLLSREENKSVEVMTGVHLNAKHSNARRIDFWVLYGVLSCDPKILFREEASQLATKCFDVILEVCTSDIKLQFQGFTALHLWFKHLLNGPCNAKLVLDKELVSVALDLVWNNWDSQVVGAVDIILQVFGYVLDFLAKDLLSVTNIVMHLLKTPAHVKGRYGPLCLCINKFGYQIVFDGDPNFALDLISGLGVNHLASCVSKVYKAIAFSTFKNKDTFNAQKWENLLGCPLVGALLSDTPLIQQNALTYLVPVNINLNSTVLPLLLQCISRGVGKDKVLACYDAKLTAIIGVLKVARSTGKIEFEKLDLEIIHQAFSSYQNETRANAFWVVCKSQRKADLVSEAELRFLYEKIPLNMNIDCTAFRHEFSSCLIALFERIQCSVLAGAKQKNVEYVEICTKFLSWLLGLCLESLHVCFTYQRKITALSTYKLLLTYFSFKGETTSKKLLISQEDISILENVIDRCGTALLSSSTALSLFHLAADVVPEIRETALNLLTDYFPFKLLSEFENAVSCSMRSLANSPKAQDTESGSLLAQLYFHFLRKSTCLQSGDGNIFSHESWKRNFVFIQELLYRLQENFCCFSEDFLKSSYQNPIHGWLLVLAGCFDSFSLLQNLPLVFSDEIPSLISNTISILTNIVHFFLSRLFSCSDDVENRYTASADFRELSNRICKIIFTSKQAANKKAMPKEDILLSQDFEVVLSSSWLALKNCCLSLSSLGLFLQSNWTYHISIDHRKQQMSEICSVFTTVLFMCRHRGVIESCYSSFVAFLTCLFKSVTYCSIPSTFLNSLLESQRQRGSGTQLIEGGSITRRSAGIPLVIDAILTANVAANCSSNMLTDCVNTLLGSLRFLKELDDKTVCISADLPQVDALYILKSTFQNNKLGPLLTVHLPSVYMASLDCLDSSFWVVRNAATCLLGILSARMLGQQHIEKKFTNSLTASEFFTRFPKLMVYFRQTFEDGIKMPKKNFDREQYFLKPAIYPIISLLSKLAYHQAVRKKDMDLGFITTASEELLTCRFLPARTATCELLLSLHSVDHLLEKSLGYLQSLPTTSKLTKNHRLQQNELHGWLSLTSMVFEKFQNVPFPKIIELQDILRSRSWLAVLQHNPCPLTASLYLNVVIHLSESSTGRCECVNDDQLVLDATNKSLNFLVGYSGYVREVTKYLIISKDLLRLKQMLVAEHNSSANLLCHRFCFDHLANSNELLKKHGPLHFVEFITDVWKQQNQSMDKLDILAEKAFLNFLVNLNHRNEDFCVLKGDRLSLISDHIFSCSYNSLSLKCLKIRSMSLVIVWETKSNTSHATIIQHARSWINELSNSTFVTRMPEPQRLSAAMSLKDAGIEILDWIQRVLKQNEEFKDELLKIVSLMCYAALLLLHDEQSEIREPVCELVASLRAERKVSKLQHNYATEVLLTHFTANFSSVHLIDKFLELCEKENAPTLNCEQSLFRQEAFNLYVQFEQLALTVQIFAKVAAKKVSDISEEWINRKLEKSNQFLATIFDLKDIGWNRLLRYAICSLVYVDVTLHLVKAFSIKTNNVTWCTVKSKFSRVSKMNFPCSFLERLCDNIKSQYFSAVEEKP